MNRKLSIRELLGLLLILLMSFLMNQFVIEKPFFLLYSNLKKNITEIVLVLIIGVIGIYGLKSKKHIWRETLWVIVYISSLLIFITFTIVDTFFFKISTPNGQLRINTFGQLLGGPVPYIILLAISFFKK